MIFDVAVPQHGFRHVVFMELGEKFATRFAQGVDEDIETAAVGHADGHFLDAGVRTGFQKGVENGDKGFPSFEGKALLADVAGVEKTFERFGGNDFFEDATLLLRREGGLVARAFHAVAEPAADGEVHDVHELDSDVVAVGLF